MINIGSSAQKIINNIKNAGKRQELLMSMSKQNASVFFNEYLKLLKDDNEFYYANLIKITL